MIRAGSLVQDLRFAFRQLRKTPGFSLTAILIMALGIGAATSIFSLVEGILLRPLPFSDPDRLVLLGEHLGSSPNIPVRAREIGTYSTAAHAFSSMGSFATRNYEISGGSIPEEVVAARLTAGVFPTLGVPPVLGRVFTEQEEEDARQLLAVLSYSLWTNRYNRDSHVLGSSIVLDRKSYTIIGVMPRDFEFPLQPGRLGQVQLWVPMSLTDQELSEQSTGYWGYNMVARMKQGITATQAATDVDRVAQQIMRDFPPSMSALRIRGDTTLLRESVVANVSKLLRYLLVGVFVVLLIACVNVSGLLLVRAIRRRREDAVCLALGAGSGVIVRKAIFEGMVLSVFGAVLGLALAAGVIRTSLYLLPDSMPRISSISMDTTVATFALLVGLASGILCSLAPAFAALRTNLIESLKEGGPSTTGATSHSWLRSALVVAEIAVALILVILSTAFLRSFQKMRAVNPGFSVDHVLVAHYRLLPGGTSAESFNREVVDRLSNKPGVIAAGISSVLPAASGGIPQSAYTAEGMSAERWKLKFAGFSLTYGDYFRAMGIPLIEGRTFTANDRSNAPLVVIVNQSMARTCWPGQKAVGKRIHVGNPHKAMPWATVVGVVADTKLGSRDEPSIDQWYIPAQQPAILALPEESSGLPSANITLRASLPPEQMIETLRSTVAEIDPLLPLQDVQPMKDALTNVEAPRRFNTDLITAFALGAFLLAVIGIYAVVAFSVSSRTHEIAIRMALGANRSGIARLVLFSGTKLGIIGCAIGVLGSWAVSRFVESFLFEVSATDPYIYATGVVMMMLMALLASVLPATRAASADPIDALRAM
ncbi:MAG TPA: ABC transporter permease [Candidatus Angelobacter sp.]|jgi:putative ABC transport system permease protein|nr:ABC transporter permease [Candidatus Angelobacter sp.]